jgi:ubiquinone/menaquinone biosynthesis C-methylase UbiE
MAGVVDGSVDFVHSSHCLEHMVDVRETLKNWIRIGATPALFNGIVSRKLRCAPK